MKGAFCLRMSAFALFGVFAASSFGSYITLTSGTSSVTLDNNGGADAGMANSWIAGGANRLFQEEYFFRTGTSGAMQGFGALGDPLGTQLLPNIAQFTYGHTGGITASVLYMLVAGGNAADLAETVMITNTGRELAHFEFIEYDDFDLGGIGSYDHAQINNATSIGQWHGSLALNAEVVTSPSSNYKEVNGFPVLLNKIQSASFTNLDSNNSAYDGDATFAFQWVMDLQPGQSFIMSKDKLMAVPEPSTLAAFGGLLAIALRRRSKK